MSCCNTSCLQTHHQRMILVLRSGNNRLNDMRHDIVDLRLCVMGGRSSFRVTWHVFRFRKKFQASARSGLHIDCHLVVELESLFKGAKFETRSLKVFEKHVTYTFCYVYETSCHLYLNTFKVKCINFKVWAINLKITIKFNDISHVKVALSSFKWNWICVN